MKSLKFTHNACGTPLVVRSTTGRYPAKVTCPKCAGVIVLGSKTPPVAAAQKRPAPAHIQAVKP